MIEKIHRFQGRGSLRFAYQRGQTVRGQFSSLKFVLNRRRNTFRVAVVVSRKVSKSAVVRNRIRRRIYELIRQLPLPQTAAYDLVITVYSDQLAQLAWPELTHMLVGQLQKAGVLDPKIPYATPDHAIVETKKESNNV